ncbi:MAG: hypothetical protein DRN42_05390, partial [Thermoplasmata archaeon]
MKEKIMKLRFCVVFLLLTALLLPTLPPSLPGSAEGEEGGFRGYVSHNPIRVDNDVELAAVATSGSGTFLDPYIIEGYLIKGNGAGAGIYIGNTTKYFIIRNCLIQDTARDHPGAGIHLYKVDNGGISNVVLEDNYYGIYVYYCSNIIILNVKIEGSYTGMFLFELEQGSVKGSTISNSSYGMHLSMCYNVDVISNTITNTTMGMRLSLTRVTHIEENQVEARKIGVYLDDSHYIRLRKNAFTNCSVLMYGNFPSYWDSHEFYGNTVNRRSIVYLKNATTLPFVRSPGEFILVNCSGFELSGASLRGGTSGILMAFSHDITVSDPVITDMRDSGVYATFCSGITVSGGEIRGYEALTPEGWVDRAGDGIYFENSEKISVLGNTISGFKYDIHFYNTQKIRAENNKMSRQFGLWGYDREDWTGHRITTTNVIEGKSVLYLSEVDGVRVQTDAAEVIVAGSRNVEITGMEFSIALKPLTLAFSENISIHHNNFHNVSTAIRFLSVNSSVVYANNFMCNYMDIYIDDSHYNLFYHNNFFRCGEYANFSGIDYFFMCIGNRWNLSYPLGGNYWSFYNGTDNFSGENQDQEGWDGIGDTAYEGPWRIFVDYYPLMYPYEEVPPEINITHPGDGEWVNSGDVEISWEGRDDGSAVRWYDVRVDRGTWVRVGRNTTFNVSLSEGAHVVSVRGEDCSGNTALDTITFGVDTTAPTVNITSPEDGYVDTTQVTLRWEGEDLGGIDHYEVKVDDGAWEEVGNATEKVLTGLAEGWHTAYVRVYDKAGNYGEANVTFGIDSHMPHVRVVFPLNGTYLNTTNVTLLWEAWDNETGIRDCLIKLDGGIWINTRGQTVWNLTDLTEGFHYVWIRAMDYRGFSETVNVSFYVDRTPPEVVSISPLGDNVSLSAPLVVVFSEAVDPTTLNFSITPTPPGLNLTWSDNGTVLTITHDGLEEGTNYTFRVIYYRDLAGNVGGGAVSAFRTAEAAAEERGVVRGRVVNENG